MESFPDKSNPAQTELFPLDHDMSEPVTGEMIEQMEAQKEIAGNAWNLAKNMTEDAQNGRGEGVKLVDGFNRIYTGKRHDVKVFARESEARPEQLNKAVDTTQVLMHLKDSNNELYVQQSVTADGSSELRAFTVQTPEGGFDSNVKSALFGNAVLHALDATFRSDRTGLSEDRFYVIEKTEYLQPATPEDVAYFANTLGYEETT